MKLKDVKSNSKYYVILILGLVHLSGCSTSTEGVITIQEIDIEKNMSNFEDVYLSHFSDTIVYIALETRDDVLLNDITEFDIGEEYIVTCDNESSIVIFDRNGRIVQKFGHVGMGPGEYQSVGDLSIRDGIISFSSQYDMFYYNTEGILIKRLNGLLSIRDKYLLRNSEVINDTMIFGYVPNESGDCEICAAVVNVSGDEEAAFRNYNLIDFKGTRIFPGSAQIYTFNGMISFKEQFADTLFRLGSDYNLTPAFTFNLGSLKIPVTVRSNFYEYFSSFKEYISINDIYETDDYLFLKIDYGNHFPYKHITAPSDASGNANSTFCLGIYSKGARELYFCKPDYMGRSLGDAGLINDLDAGPRFFPMKMVNDSTLAMLIQANSLKRHVASSDFHHAKAIHPSGKEQLKLFADSLLESDNPVLVLIQLKRQ